MRDSSLPPVLELDPAELDMVDGGMRLSPFSPGIRVEDQRGWWDMSRSSGPLSSGYVMYHG